MDNHVTRQGHLSSGEALLPDRRSTTIPRYKQRTLVSAHYQPHSTHNGRFCTYSSFRYPRLAKCAKCDTPSLRHRATDLHPTFSEKLAYAQVLTPPLQRSAASKIDWANLGAKLGLRGTTAQALQTFKKRNDDARRKVQVLSEQPQQVDFAHYRSILKNTAIVDDIEKQFNAFQVKKYDVGRQIKAIEAYEATALKSAEETKSKVDAELKDLDKTLKNIETARPFEDLTVVRICWDWDPRELIRGGQDHVISVSDKTNRTRLSPPTPRSTSVLSSSFPRAAGACPATRRSSATFPCCRGSRSRGSCCCCAITISFVHNRTVFFFATPKSSPLSLAERSRSLLPSVASYRLSCMSLTIRVPQPSGTHTHEGSAYKIRIVLRNSSHLAVMLGLTDVRFHTPHYLLARRLSRHLSTEAVESA